MEITFLEEIDSTNTYLKDKENKKNWETVAADIQTAGRGRRDKKWFSGKGGAWFSIAIKEDKNITMQEMLKLPFIVCYAVINKTEEIAGLELKYKWTNDIYCNEKKLCGILIEKSGDFFIIGIGINVNNVEFGEFGDIATSLACEINREFNIKEIIEAVVDEIKSSYSMFLRGEWSIIIQYLREKDFLLNRKIVVNTEEKEITGEALGLDEDAFLMIRTINGNEKINTGDIFWKHNI